MNKTTWMLAAMLSCGSAAAQAATDPAEPNLQAWARWQGRVSFNATGTEWTAQKLSSLSLMGDYYFSDAWRLAGATGGLRATGGLILGPRSQAGARPLGTSTGNHLLGEGAPPTWGDASADNATLPYLGVGYSAASLRNGWSFNADLGMVAQYPGSVARLGRGQSLDDVVRELRLTPVLQLGVSYAF